ncbi:MAG: alpha/beta hydrolase [Gammaproteobacteria bacterium]
MAGTDPEVKRLLELAAQMGLPDVNTLPVAEARAQFLGTRPALAGALASVHAVHDAAVPGPSGSVPIRLYRPAASSPLPALIYFHGGGWVIGNLDSHDDICRALCAHSSCAVIAVDYRLAPEYKFPAAVDDALAATRWIAEHAPTFGVDPARLAIGGDSAGGNLAAAVTQIIRDGGGPAIRLQLLIYPATDMTLASPSIRRFAEGYRLTRAAMQWFVGHYLHSEADRHDTRASPLFAQNFRDLPPTYIITAGFDPLLDEGRAYADKLQASGVAVEYRCYEGMIHGFFGMAGALSMAGEAQRDAARALKQALGA